MYANFWANLACDYYVLTYVLNLKFANTYFNKFDFSYKKKDNETKTENSTKYTYVSTFILTCSTYIGSTVLACRCVFLQVVCYIAGFAIRSSLCTHSAK